MTTAVKEQARRRAPAPAARPDADVTLRRLLLNGAQMDMRLEQAITGADLELTIDGASTLTLTVYDPDKKLLKSKILNRDAIIELDGRIYALAAVGKSGHETTLTFEDQLIGQLRRNKAMRKAFRNKVTRAEFVLSLVKRDAARYGFTFEFVSPELHKKQPIKSEAEAPSEEERVDQRDRGLPDDAQVTVKGVLASHEQIINMEIILDVGVSMDAPRPVLVAAIATGIEESTMKNLAGGDRDSVGVFQQRASQGWTGLRDVHKAAAEFFERAIAVYKDDPQMPIYEIAHSVQRNFDTETKGRKTYGRWVTEAKKTVTEYGIAPDEVVGPQQEVRFEFSQGQPGSPETTWEAIRRLSSEVQWRAFVVGRKLYFIRDKALMRSKPIARLAEGEAGVDNIDFDFDIGKPLGEATVTCRIERWTAPPGSVVTVAGCGPADGRWLVSRISRSLFSPVAEITIIQPQPQLPEPASGTEDVRSERRLSGDTLRAKVASAAERAYNERQKYTYRQYRPMADSLFAPEAFNRTDCSSFATLCYKAAGAPNPNGGEYNDYGYTGTLAARGTKVERPMVGDLAFYGGTEQVPGHVAVYIGNGECIGFGSTPIRKHRWDYRSDFQYFRSYLPEPGGLERDSL